MASFPLRLNHEFFLITTCFLKKSYHIKVSPSKFFQLWQPNYFLTSHRKSTKQQLTELINFDYSIRKMNISCKTNPAVLLYLANERNLSSPLLTDTLCYRKPETVPKIIVWVMNRIRPETRFLMEMNYREWKKEDNEGEKTTTKAAETPTDNPDSALRSQSPSLWQHWWQCLHWVTGPIHLAQRVKTQTQAV